MSTGISEQEMYRLLGVKDKEELSNIIRKNVSEDLSIEYCNENTIFIVNKNKSISFDEHAYTIEIAKHSSKVKKHNEYIEDFFEENEFTKKRYGKICIGLEEIKEILYKKLKRWNKYLNGDFKKTFFKNLGFCVDDDSSDWMHYNDYFDIGHILAGSIFDSYLRANQNCYPKDFKNKIFFPQTKYANANGCKLGEKLDKKYSHRDQYYYENIIRCHKLSFLNKTGTIIKKISEDEKRKIENFSNKLIFYNDCKPKLFYGVSVIYYDIQDNFPIGTLLESKVFNLGYKNNVPENQKANFFVFIPNVSPNWVGNKKYNIRELNYKLSENLKNSK
ncbi:hypothetical protein [Floricoccus penangensis]|uniref:hypothetical protein n=1 Tax=Floricoccus penangensis TaxID=1859475 RepID=UPI002040F306|nr:hypothetical protein [Floricoccus penangensis]URZ87919.1 hypothetical protein KIW23_02405 [Floricoccus penangensis]